MKKIRQRNSQLIPDAACEVSVDCGFDATRLNGVAKCVGVAKTNVLYYYHSGAQLCKVVLDSIVESLLETSRPFAGNQSPVEALRAHIDNKIHIGAERPYAARILSCEIIRDTSHIPATLPGRLGAQTERNAERIHQWISEGPLTPLDPYHSLLNLWVVAESYAFNDWQLARLIDQIRSDTNDYRQATESIVRLVCAGCLALPGEATPRRRFHALAGWATCARSVSA